LVKIPEGTKLSWLAKDAISIDVFRGQDFIKAKFSSVDEGILVEIPKKDAHGILNVSVTTTRRPKVNETFELDLGRGAFAQALDFGRLIFEDISSKLSESARSAQADFEETLKVVKTSFTEAREQAGQQIEKVWREAETMSPKPPKWWMSFQRHLHQKQQDLQVEAEAALLKAQISANLLWLQMQGKQKEHDVYLKKASAFLKERIVTGQRAREEQKGRRKSCYKGFSFWAQQ
jgi:hypothetical protein